MPLVTTTTPFGIYTTPANPTVPIPVTKYTLTNTINSFSISIIDYGAALTNLIVPDALGQLTDVVLGFDTLEDYLGITSFENPYFGASIGRTSNRVRAGRFIMDGQQVQLSLNDGQNHLHGGFAGFDKRQFKASIISGGKVAFSYISTGGEEGYPNSVMATITYSINEENEIILEYLAMCDGPTPISLTNHTYFNLTGHKTTASKLESHMITLYANEYTPVDENLIITGDVTPVQGTKFDLRTPKDINELITNDPSGYDHNFCLNREGVPDGELVLAARVSVPNLSLEIRTDQPGLQFYTGNFLPETALLRGKESTYYYKNGAFCAETQAWPDAVNHNHFPNVLRSPGTVYKTISVYSFIY
ncbi:galactose mutarotase [Folsomia candida]|uniref:galactose mutarotase n=1 Tax=Folsomia candida TaxID=158441 RepID=UPI000B8F1C60|nr:galactose mutarotase [Folsomia candida]